MDYKHFIYDTITEFTGQNNTLSISVTFIDFVDDLETGLFLSQVIYWADRVKRSDGYFYKTDDEWNQEIKLSKYSVRKARKKLEEMGLLETVVKKANGNPTVHYKFDKDKFTQLFISFLRNRKNESSESQNGTFENEQSLTEITTENTTEITTNIYIPFAEVIDYLNNKTGSSYKSTTRKTKDLIKARINEGFTLDDFKKVIDNKTAEWLNDSNMSKYLRPETLFGNKFESYLNQKGGGQPDGLKENERNILEQYNFDKERPINF